MVKKTRYDVKYLSTLQVHDWTDEFDVAIKAADPSAPRPEWRLGEGFTAAEGWFMKIFNPHSVQYLHRHDIAPGY